jgi:hypothetical protein
MVAWQLRNPGRSMPAARGCAPASACRAGLALTLPPSRHTIAVYCKHSVCFHVSFYVAGKRPQSLRSLHVCSTATHHEGGTHARAHTVTQRESKLVCLCVAMSSCHTPQAQAAEACPVVVGMWGKGTCWCLAGGLFYPAEWRAGDDDHRRRSKGNNRLGDGSWATATPAPAAASGRLHDENKQPKVVHAALHAAFAFWASHLLPSACAADADAGAASSFRFRSPGPLAARSHRRQGHMT